MDIDTLVKKLTWKKLAVGILVFILSAWVLRLLLFLVLFPQTLKMINQINTTFNQEQSYIHNKLIESEKDFDKTAKEYDAVFDGISKGIDASSKRMQADMKELDDRAVERDKKFNKLFNIE